VELVDGILEKLEEIDSLITELVTNWEFSRIAKIDLAILRLGIYEILYRLDVPPVVVIDEALEISKDFSSDNSRKFLNGVLDQASKRSGRPNRESLV
jgi:N utilization substance protein B